MLTGEEIARACVIDARVTRPKKPQVLAAKLPGKKISGVTRRGKYLRLELVGGSMMVIHLRMTGVLTYVEKGAGQSNWPHLSLILEFTGGDSLVFQDQRRFGTAALLTAPEAASLFGRLGPEPLTRSFGAVQLARLVRNRKRPVKSLLLDQGVIAGIGNIYADEALFRARIHPLRDAGSLNEAEVKRLSGAIKSTLRDAIKLEGSSISNYRSARGRRGRFQETFRVHRRQGEPCPGCGGSVEKTRVGGRGTYFCPVCQKMTPG